MPGGVEAKQGQDRFLHSLDVMFCWFFLRLAGVNEAPVGVGVHRIIERSVHQAKLVRLQSLKLLETVAFSPIKKIKELILNFMERGGWGLQFGFFKEKSQN
jgi:hypothetical protein